ncbi:Cleavage polyadenylation specificity factor CPSF30 [Diplonema papillatum]|nr:Cleavage polyadenylation specificity factor CPSF30 [Diplonema papillatum]
MFQDDDFNDMQVDFEKQLPVETTTKRNICFDYQSGNCTRGTTCPYKHSFTNRSRVEDEVCKYWLRGLCAMQSDCTYLHEYQSSKIPECFFFKRFGECSNPECVFQHVLLDDTIPECAAYRRGFCKYGPYCRLKHVKKEACPNWMAGFCREGNSCKMGHPQLRYYTEESIRERLQAGESIDEAVEDWMSSGLRLCFRCGEPGHTAVHCTDSGHSRLQKIMRALEKIVQEPQGVGCFHCKSEEHLSVECPQKKDRYMMHREGQQDARGDIRQEDKQRARCFRCGEEGHVNRNCPLALAEKAKGISPGIRCFICQEPSHTAAHCPKKDGGASNVASNGASDVFSAILNAAQQQQVSAPPNPPSSDYPPPPPGAPPTHPPRPLGPPPGFAPPNHVSR